MGLLFLALKEPIPPIFRLLRNVYERMSTSDTKKIRLFPLWLRFSFLGYGYESQFLASVYERSIDAFDLQKAWV